MTASQFQCVLDARAGIGECPTWSLADRALWWVDIVGRTLNRFDPATGAAQALPMPADIGSFGLRAAGGFVAALRDGLWLVDDRGVLQRRVATAPYDSSTHRFNDGRCDPFGRFWVGSMNERRDAASAKLWRLDADLSLHEMVDGLTISNGLGWSPDARTMYHADTPAHTVWSWRVDPTGEIADRRVFARFEGETDRPDGAAVDRDGHYWVAFYRGAKVVRIAPDGGVVAEYPTPCVCPTACAFGGPDLRTLFVTSATHERPADEIRRYPQSGGLFAMAVDVPGRPEPLFSG